jgi:hypothetical protein
MEKKMSKEWTEKEIERELEMIGEIAGSKPQTLRYHGQKAQLIVNNFSLGARVQVLFKFNNGQTGEGVGPTIGEALTKARYAAETFSAIS